MSNLNDKQ